MSGGRAPRAGPAALSCAWAVVVALLLQAALPKDASGAGTPAGTVIPYQASATYSSPGWSSPAIAYSNTLSVVVAQVAVVNIAPPAARGESRVDAAVDYPLTMTNSGNGADRFAVSSTSTLGLPSAVYWDMDGNGVLGGEEVAAGPLGETRALPADSSVACLVRVQIPPSVALIGQTDQLTVTAASVFDGSRIARAQLSTSIVGAAMAVVKGVNIPLPRAGDRVTYTITYRNNGTAVATGVSLVDVLDPRLRFAGGGTTKAPDRVNGQTLTWDIGSVGSGEEGTIEFYAEIASTAVPGDEVHNAAVMRYEDGPNGRIAESTEASFITIQSGGAVTVGITSPQATTGQPGDTVQYAYAVTNSGTFAETFVLSTSSTLGLDWLLYQDLNTNWKVDPGETVAATGPIQPGGIFTVIARTTLPRVTADLTRDVMSLRAMSTTNGNNTNAVYSTTTIVLPRMTLTKQAAAADPRSGQEILYTIAYANDGHGQANGFAVSDAIPPSTSLVPGSVRINGAVRTERADGDEATLQDGVLTVKVGTVMPGDRGVVEFRVRIR